MTDDFKKARDEASNKPDSYFGFGNAFKEGADFGYQFALDESSAKIDELTARLNIAIGIIEKDIKNSHFEFCHKECKCKNRLDRLVRLKESE